MKLFPTIRVFLSLFIVLVALGACKRDEPVLELDQEEFDKVEVVFKNKEDLTDSVRIVFNRFGVPEKEVYHLDVKKTYFMRLSLLKDNVSLNDEIEEEHEEHQFFFFAPEESILNYNYLDKRIGLYGEITFGNYLQPFLLRVLLRHGLDKGSEQAAQWNHPLYMQAGGVDDLVLQIPLQLK